MRTDKLNGMDRFVREIGDRLMGLHLTDEQAAFLIARIQSRTRYVCARNPAAFEDVRRAARSTPGIPQAKSLYVRTKSGKRKLLGIKKR